MAAAIAASSGSYAPGTNISCTVAAGSDRALLLFLVTGTEPTVARDGQSFTRIMAINEYTSVWRLVAPNTGTADIVVTGGSAVYAATLFQLTGVDQATPERGAVAFTLDQTNTASSVSDVMTTVSGDMVCDMVVAGQGDPAITVGAGQTQVHQSTDSDYRYAGSYEAASGTSTTMSWSAGGNLTYWLQVSVVMQAAGGGGGGSVGVRSYYAQG